MKRKSLVVLIALSMVGLASCNLNNDSIGQKSSSASSAASSGEGTSSLSASSTASSSASSSASSAGSSSSSASSSSASSSSTDYKGFLKTFLATFSSANATLTVDGFVKHEFLGPKAEFSTYLGDYATNGNYGYLVNGAQGIFDFELVDDAVVIGDIESPSSLSVTDLFYTVHDLAYTSSAWTSEGNYVYATADESIGTLLCVLGGYGSYVAYADSFATTMTVSSDGKTAAISTELVIGSESATVDATISDIGTTKENVISAYLDSPKTLVPPTAWKAETQDAMTNLLNEVLPLPTGLSYAVKEAIEKDDEGNASTIEIDDYASGDILSAYQDTIVADGWVYSSSRTNLDDLENYGYIMYMYEKVKTPATDTTGPVVYTLQVQYIPTSALSDDEATIYPFGEFEIIGTVYSSPLVKTIDADGLNAYYANLKKADGSAALPTFAIGEETTGIVLTDYTFTASALWGIDFVNYSVAALSIADESVAAAEAKAFGEALVAVGFVDGGETLEKDGELEYDLTDDAYALLGFSVILAPEFNSDETYSGVLTITILAA